MLNFFKSFLQNKSGSIMPVFACAIIPIMSIGGVALDYAYLSRNSTQVSNFADAALLSIAREASDLINTKSIDDAKEEIEAKLMPLLKERLSSNGNMSFKIHNITYDPAAGGLRVDIEVIQDTTLLSLVKIDQIKSIVTTGISVGGGLRGPLSVAFVLDKSGSMQGKDKWGELRKALKGMRDKFKEMDPDKKYIRTGLLPFDDQTYSFAGFKWGMGGVMSGFRGFTPGGNTNSSGAMANAYNSLISNEEKLIHKNKNNGELQKYIVFLTDGINSNDQFTVDTVSTCSAAKEAGMEIFSIAFGENISAGAAQMMQTCANDDEHYFLATDANALQEAFKQIGESAASNFYLSQ